MMKIANYVRYVGDADKVSELRPAHRAFMSELLRQNKLVAGGPFVDGSGAIFVYEVQDLIEAERLVAADPYTTGGAILSHELKQWIIVSANTSLFESSSASH
jgi:uncharacterized protein YciI